MGTKWQIIGHSDATIAEAIVNNDSTIILVIPGGGYDHLSPREANPISNKLNNLGYNSAVFRYSVFPAGKKEILEEADIVIEELSKRYANIVVMGFSAGGHLAGMIGTSEYKNVKAMVLCYPVISFEENSHEGTRKVFLSKDDTIDNRKIYSIDRRVNEKTPPCFIWTCEDDESVPIDNSLRMAKALEEKGIYHELVVFKGGKHGMALADETAIKDGDTSYVNKEVQSWIEKADKFIKKVL